MLSVSVSVKAQLFAVFFFKLQLDGSSAVLSCLFAIFQTDFDRLVMLLC